MLPHPTKTIQAVPPPSTNNRFPSATIPPPVPFLRKADGAAQQTQAFSLDGYNPVPFSMANFL
jgi:hypothetical protein